VPLLLPQQQEQQLLAALQAAADQSGPATAAVLFQLQCGAAGGAALAGRLLLPDALITITPLYSKRLAALPFSQALQRQLPAGSVDMGYLSMDQARNLVPLGASDSLVRPAAARCCRAPALCAGPRRVPAEALGEPPGSSARPAASCAC
jgi:hypothetical protein